MGKNQHWVPQFLLKYFSCPNTKRAIALVVLDQKKPIHQASIADQCSKSWTYGKDGTAEALFCEIEGFAGSVIKQIVETGNVPQRGTDEHEVLALFIASQHGRTPSAALEMQERSTRALRGMLMSMPGLIARGITADKINTISVKHDRPELHSAANSMKLFPCLLDLQDLIVENKSKLGFVLPDTGVVLHNEWARDARGSGTLGYTCQGLQILLPLSPTRLLIKYDSSTYRVRHVEHGKFAATKIVSANRLDVTKINKLMIAYAERAVYFTGDTLTETFLTQDHFRAPRHKYVSSERLTEEGGPSKMIYQHYEHPPVSFQVEWLVVHSALKSIPGHLRGHRFREAAMRASPLPSRSVPASLRGRRFRPE